MSTVLWANILKADGTVLSEQADYYALYQHTERLDKLSREAGLVSFQSLCDLTDVQVNMDVLALPPDMTSSDELMAKQGSWIEPAKAVGLLQALIQTIEQKNVRFGLLSNKQAEVLEELREALAFARQHAGQGDAANPPARGFNFSVVT